MVGVAAMRLEVIVSGCGIGLMQMQGKVVYNRCANALGLALPWNPLWWEHYCEVAFFGIQGRYSDFEQGWLLGCLAL